MCLIKHMIFTLKFSNDRRIVLFHVVFISIHLQPAEKNPFRGKGESQEKHAYLMIASLGLYLSSFTPITYIGASADGAEMTTFFAPPSK